MSVESSVYKITCFPDICMVGRMFQMSFIGVCIIYITLPDMHAPYVPSLYHCCCTLIMYRLISVAYRHATPLYHYNSCPLCMHQFNINHCTVTIIFHFITVPSQHPCTYHYLKVLFIPPPPPSSSSTIPSPYHHPPCISSSPPYHHTLVPLHHCTPSL